MIAFESSVLDVPPEPPPLDTARDVVLPLQIHFINVGQGDCTMVIAPNGKRLLVDCGTSGGGIDRQAVRDYVVSLLDPEDPRVHAMVITHPDSDHYVMLEEVLANVPVDHVYTVGPAAEFTSNGTDEWLGNFGEGQYTILKRQDFTSSTPARLGNIDFGDVDVYVLAANVQSSVSASNARSVVLKVTYNEFDALLTGDATFATEKDILARFGNQPEFLDVELLKIGHHGSETTSTSDTWAAAVKPEVAVVSCAFTNSHGHPRRNVLKRLEPFTNAAAAHPMREYPSQRVKAEIPEYDEAIYSTATNGTVIVTSTGSTEFRVSHD